MARPASHPEAARAALRQHIFTIYCKHRDQCGGQVDVTATDRAAAIASLPGWTQDETGVINCPRCNALTQPNPTAARAALARLDDMLTPRPKLVYTDVDGTQYFRDARGAIVNRRGERVATTTEDNIETMLRAEGR